MLLHGDVEHLGGRGAVDVAALAEGVEHPLLAGEPGQHPRLDRAEVAHREGPAIARDEGRADELRQGVRHALVAELQHLQVAVLEGLAGEVEVGDVVLREVLQLDEPSGPAAGPRALELEQAPDAVVGADAVEHRLVLGVGGLAQLRADVEDAQHPLVAGDPAELRQVLLREGVHVDAQLCGQPVLELGDAVGIGQPGELHRLLGEPGGDDGVDAAGLAGQRGVHLHAHVVDGLVHGVEPVLPGGDVEPGGLAVDLPLHLHVADAVGLEGLPLLGEVLREVAVALVEDAVGLLLPRHAEELDEVLALLHLLLLQAECRAGLLQAHGEPTAGGLDHRAVPGVGGEEDALLACLRLPEVDGQAHPLEGGVVGHLRHLLVEEGVDQPLRQALALGEVHDLHGLLVPRVGHQQDPEVRVHGVAVESGLCDRLRGEGFDV